MYGRRIWLLVFAALLLAPGVGGGAPGVPTPGGPPEAPQLDAVYQALETQLRTLEQLQFRLRDTERQREVAVMADAVRGDLERLRSRERLREREQVHALLGSCLNTAERHEERLRAMLGESPEAMRRALQLALAASLRVQAAVRAQQRTFSAPQGAEPRVDSRRPSRGSKGTPHAGGGRGGTAAGRGRGSSR